MEEVGKISILEVSNLNKSNPELNVGVDSTKNTSNLNKTNDLEVETTSSRNIIVSSEDLQNLFNNEQLNKNVVTV